MTDTNKERADFEAHWYDLYHCGSISPDADGRYINPSVQRAWEAWQARAAKAPAAEPFAYCQPDDPLSSTAFVWPGIKRDPRHTMPLYTAPPAPTEQWIGVTERLPEWVHRDDTPCHINGKEVPPTLTSKTVLVALDGGGVRTDKLTTIEGKSNGWWNTFGERVIAWQDAPAPPQGAAKGE